MSAQVQAQLLAALELIATAPDIRRCYGTLWHDQALAAIEAAKAEIRPVIARADAPVLAIIIEGGMVSDIVSNRPEFFADVDVLTIDYDGDGMAVRQRDGTFSQAEVSDCPVDRAAIDLPALSAALDELDEADDDGCPKGDPKCLGNNGDCHDACESQESEQ